jgi:hypothetical protein
VADLIRLKGEAHTFDPRLDRIPSYDPRSRRFPVRALIADATGTDRPPLRSFTWQVGSVLDQGNEGACVGFAHSARVMSDPDRDRGIDNAYAREVYRAAQRVDEWPGECVDEQTQCLSRRGWLGPAELQEGDEILTFDLETEMTRWATVQKVHRYAEAPYRLWSQRGFAVAVTDNHRWPVRLRPNGAGFPRPFRMTTTSQWRTGDEFLRAAPCADQPGEPKWDDDFVELVAWVACEGYYRPPTRRGHGIVVTQKVCMDRVKALMSRLGVAPGFLKTDGAWSWELSGSLAAEVRRVAPGRAPAVWWLASLTRRQLLLFLEVCELADGHLVLAADSRKPRRMFGQKPGAILDAWLAAAALAGVAISRARSGEVENWTVDRTNRVEVRRLQPSPYLVGPVWCPQTEVGTFVARRGGSIFITGNSYEGTSVLAGAKVLAGRGEYTAYHWAFSIEDVLWSIGYLGPVVLGIPWTNGMFRPRPSGLLEVTGSIEGGHAILARGVRLKARLPGEGLDPIEVVRLRNSWGMWGAGGDCYIRVDDLEQLLKADGDACVPTEPRQKQ